MRGPAFKGEKVSERRAAVNRGRAHWPESRAPRPRWRRPVTDRVQFSDRPADALRQKAREEEKKAQEKKNTP